MSHTVTAKLNNFAKKKETSNGYSFFLTLGEKNYDRKEKKTKWTNYTATLFCKESSVMYYENVLITGAVISVSGSGLIIRIPEDQKYGPSLEIQEARLEFAYGGAVPPPQSAQEAVSHPAPEMDSFDDDIPF